ncbi:Rieske 2Fe-2S domain-containing protein [Caulobacter sp. AP07]|uniref:Rieske 2Fe-2S domain-containing protein n=1 Tax=Caulobacter sp. AP07 TaxID=1144304 RepID=UPI001EE66581|nr:Rieske 2Fe-2S domain-containing protein [Caulobacter sp. AP07]
MGELLRRYWHPVGLSNDAGDVPRKVRALGEDLILFRDGNGRAGLVHDRCCHRGTTLYYGKVEDRGIRCCYHGWLFDVEGRCLEQPAEPNLGEQFRGKVRQPWYPTKEQYGLVFAYMGPPERMPVLPRWACLETLDEGEFIDADDNSIGSGGGVVVPCNWLQHYENVADPYHVPILHGSFSGTQFTEIMNRFPKEVEFAFTERGVKIRTTRPVEGKGTLNRITEVLLPTIRGVPNPVHGAFGVPVESLGWTLPIDDTHYRIYTAGRVREKGVFLPRAEGGALTRASWFDMSEEERRAKPGDYEAQTGQGPITLHSEEHLASSDRGVVMVRRLLEKQLKVVAEGGDPIGVSYDGNAPPIRLEAGNWLAQES